MTLFVLGEKFAFVFYGIQHQCGFLTVIETWVAHESFESKVTPNILIVRVVVRVMLFR